MKKTYLVPLEFEVEADTPEEANTFVVNAFSLDQDYPEPIKHVWSAGKIKEKTD
ncbi:hypothetical protein ES703_91032 [subsurface metagenome]